VERCRVDPELGAHGRPPLADSMEVGLAQLACLADVCESTLPGRSLISSSCRSNALVEYGITTP
jgi:hypothetical protein